MINYWRKLSVNLIKEDLLKMKYRHFFVEDNDKASRAMVLLRPNLEDKTLIKILCRNLFIDSIIWTDRLGIILNNLTWFHHVTMYHKYEFVNKSYIINIKTVDSLISS